MRYRIKNWRQYQHYKGRRPPWIKVHKSILTSEDWTGIPDASKVLLFVCMLAAQLDKAGDGSFNGNPAYLKKICCLDKAPNLQPLIDSEFIVIADDASISIADCKQVVLSYDSLSVSEEGGVGETAPNMVGAAGLAFRFHFLWSLPEKRGQKPYSPVQLEPMFAEHLRLHPGSFDEVMGEIERKDRLRNEWPDKMLKRLSANDNKQRTREPTLPTAQEIRERAEKEYQEALAKDERHAVAKAAAI